jgi:hypothetical protein
MKLSALLNIKEWMLILKLKNNIIKNIFMFTS